jgi:N-acyl-D-amino-acid deacylase
MENTIKSLGVEGHYSNKQILLKNGFIVDGTGTPGFIGDLMIQGESIREVSSLPIAFDGETIDCTGKVIAPGFIDVHSHLDGTLAFKGCENLKNPFVAQGCTTVVAGNCGINAGNSRKSSPFNNKVVHENYVLESSWEDLGGYFQHLEQIGISHNILDLVGNGAARFSLRGFNPRPLEGEEGRELLNRIEADLDQGAAGVSFGLQYAPDLFCTSDEIIDVARLVKKKNKILTAHGRAYSLFSGVYPRDDSGISHSLLSIREMIDVARKTGVRLQYSHLMFAGSKSHSAYRACLEEIEKARAEGIDVMTDTYPYHCGISVINVILPAWFQAELAAGKKFDENTVAGVEKALLRMRDAIGFGFEDIQLGFADHPEFKEYNGKFISEIAALMGISPIRVVLRLSAQTNGRARILNHNYSNMEVIEALIRHPACLFMTDSTVSVSGLQNPASFGSFPLLLQYARERKLIPLEEAVRKMTGASAERLQMKDRGFLNPGLAADITVFDWEQVRDNNTVTRTDQAPSGIEAVFINGIQVKSPEGVNGSVNAGKVIRI